MNLLDPIGKCSLFNLAQKAKILSIIKGERIIDLLTFLPKKSVEIIMVNNYLDILNQYNKPHTQLILLVEIDKITNYGSKQLIIEGRCYNARCKLVFFRVDRLLYSIYKPQTYVVVQGKVDVVGGVINMVHPIHKGNEITNIPFYHIEINYCSNRIKNSFIKKRIYQLLDHGHLMEWPDEWIPLKYRQEYNLPTFADAIKGIHGYGSLDMVFIKQSKQRIILDEIIFYNRMIRNYQNYSHDNRSNRILRQEITSIVNNLIGSLSMPFQLKAQQIAALETIFYDMKYKPPLFRLLQGDVGCGKTIVALIAMEWIVSEGGQCVLLSPSLTLARQHYDYFKKFLPSREVILVTSQTTQKSKERNFLLEAIGDGRASIIIGTHSLLNESIVFKNLQLVVFDEHHKFGVIQRTQLTNKFNGHILSMTATPNPRTMMLANYGFLDITTITNENNNNRTTFAMDETKVQKVLDKIPLWLEAHEKIYWICPKVQKGLSHGFSSIERFESIVNLGIGVGLVHGQMEPSLINETIENFRDNKIRILVATTVIEVGIDIQDATIIIIENAEMFGISQLHQLRGRVGRGQKQGKCLLIYNSQKDENVEKIEKFVTMESGFEVSNLDLELRGPGQLIGINQKGQKSFRFIDKYTEKVLFSMGSDMAPHGCPMDFFRQLLEIEEEQVFLKKN